VGAQFKGSRAHPLILDRFKKVKKFSLSENRKETHGEACPERERGKSKTPERISCGLKDMGAPMSKRGRVPR